MNENKSVYHESPYLKASIFSKLTFSWLNPLLRLGRKKQLVLSDLYSPVPDDETTKLTNELESAWNYELKHSKVPSLNKAVFRCYSKLAFLNSLFIIFQEIIKIIQPLFIAQILNYFNEEMELWEALVYAGLISVCAIITGCVHHPYYLNACCYGMRLRVACSGLIYRKSVKLSLRSLDSKSSGDIINLLSADVTRIEYGMYYLPYLIIGPIQVIFVIGFILYQINATFLSGLLLLVLIFPVKAFIARVFNTFKREHCAKSDERVSLLTEIMNSIKIIKMYCWEVPFSDRAVVLRNEELKYQTALNLLQSITASIDSAMTMSMTFINILFFINFTNSPLLPSLIVYAIGFYMRLCNSIGFNFTRAFIATINFKVSLNRVRSFLLIKELKDDRGIIKSENARDNLTINMENFCYSWSDDEFSIKNVSLKVQKGKLAAIVGPVGSGKSTILMGILGELEGYTGTVSTCGKIFYISQQAWIFPASIKQNIIFGKEYDKEKFDKVVEACSLKKDLELLAMGEDTMVGEKGINLSGGQRARINMARALYSDSDVYLFDDSLSAVDGTVAKNLIKNCINGYLKSKTRILVTHQVHHLETADNIYFIKSGRVEASGTYAELAKTHKELFTNSEESSTVDDLTADSQEPANTNKVDKSGANFQDKQTQLKKDREEVQQQGAVSFKSYLAYFTAGWGYLGVIVVALFFLGAQGMLIASDYWLSRWATEEKRFQTELSDCIKNSTREHCNKFKTNNTETGVYNISSDLQYFHRDEKFQTYMILCISSLVVVIIRSVLFYLLCIQNSKKIYEKLFRSVRDTYIRFFELNPLGRILNRFSKDTNNMDEMLVLFLYEFLQVFMIILGALVVPISINPWMILPLIPLGITFYFIQNYFISTGRELKRLDNIGRSPIFVHTNSTLEGICTIRSSNQLPALVKEFDEHCDYHTRAYYGFFVAHRWFGLRLDLLCSIYTVLTLFACILLKDNMGLESGEVGLLMVYLFQLFDLFQWCVVLLTYVENFMTSIERIVEYTNIPAEPFDSGKIASDKQWPQKGEILLKDVCLSYDKNLPDVLKSISLKINSGEKVGIVGRTGAGKSSFFQVLFRMYEPRGSIIIDGEEIKDLKLTHLRSRLTIIPQEPVLFSGTLRYNLDPFMKHSEQEIWKALESVSLKSYVQSMTGALDSPISSSGTNLSVGQKQLICLARAILKKTKILIIDEATANVDYQTDSIIQKTIREQFRDCTVLTIAHRLATVVDNDRILCMSEGKVLNFGKPRELLEDQSSVLYDLTRKLSPNEKKLIFDIANGKISHTTNVNVIKAETNDTATSKQSKHAYVNKGAVLNDNEIEFDSIFNL